MNKRKQLVIADKADVIVCGAGPAGVCAAIAAARNGANTCLIENAGCLGGTWTSGLLGWIMDHYGKNGLLQELKEEICKRNGTTMPPSPERSMPFDIETMKLILEDKCLDAGVRIRLHTRCVSVIKNAEGKIDYVITESKSGREAWGGKIIIDATGDGDIGFFAGCRYEIGHPDNGLTQPMSLLCLVTGIDPDECRDYVINYSPGTDAKLLLKNDLERAGVSPSYAFPSLFLLSDGLYFMMGNHQYKRFGINADDLTEATIAARREIASQIAALRSLGGRWKNIRLVATAEHIGVREGRRLKGIYEVTEKDVLSGVRHADAVCRVNFAFDVHALDPEINKGIDKVKSKVRPKPYDIPLRALISADVPNLMMAGRCISGDFLCHSGYRVTGNAAVLGEAAGTAAAKMIANKTESRELVTAF